MNFKGHKVNKRVCANVDFYSGFVYDLIGLPREVFTPLFAMSRIAGWTAHRIEELNFDSKRIIRPAYRNVSGEKEFVPLDQRNQSKAEAAPGFRQGLKGKPTECGKL